MLTHACTGLSRPACYAQQIIFGIVMLSASVFLIGVNTTPGLVAHVWLIALGMAIVFASLNVKLFRIYRIFVSTRIARQLRLSDRHLMLPFTVMVVIQMLLLVLFTLVDPASIHITFISVAVGDFVVPSVPRLAVDMSSWTLVVVACYTAALITAGAVFSFRVRHVPVQFRETQLLMAVVYQLLLMCAIVVPLVMTLEDVRTSRIVTCSAIIFSVFFTLSVLILPKVLLATGIISNVPLPRARNEAGQFMLKNSMDKDVMRPSRVERNGDVQIVRVLCCTNVCVYVYAPN